LRPVDDHRRRGDDGLRPTDPCTITSPATSVCGIVLVVATTVSWRTSTAGGTDTGCTPPHPAIISTTHNVG
jgi:hypothetical protein